LNALCSTPVAKGSLSFVYSLFQSRVVLYVFEIQVEDAFQRQGLGRKLMKMMEYFAHAAGLDRILLTVFKKNASAMEFYTKSLGYDIDESSPSKYGQSEDYEILTKKVDSSQLDL
jgi:ribosomal protein S18 acetylase RimI-like enzyme